MINLRNYNPNVIRNCPDIDECVNSNGGCQHVCKNTVSSYQCFCHSGHLLRTDEHSCEGNRDDPFYNSCTTIMYSVDINECSNSNGGCQHNCTNTIGSYYCSCAAGYSLDGNGHSCSSKI